MTREQKKYLFDISQAIGNIFDVHLSMVENDEDFATDLTVFRAVERELGIIGEACNKLKKSGIMLRNSEVMINRRNTIVHQYDAFKPSNVWSLVHRDLPDLQSEADEFLRS